MCEMSEKTIKWIAITGVIGSGKSSVIQLLKQENYQVLDCDEIAHDCLNIGETAYQEVLKAFPKTILNKDGSISRKVLAEIVFKDEEARRCLESIVHPQVLKKLMLAKAQCEEFFLFVEVPLLYECGWEQYFDEVWVVASEEAAILERLRVKRGMSLEQIRERLENQIPLSEKIKRADFVLMNDEGLTQLLVQIQERLKEEAYE